MMNHRKQQVLLIAKQIFIEKGFAATSVQDILEEAKISKGTFYNYFSTKNECLMAILEQGRDETTIRRQELIIGQDKSDKQTLAAQIATRLQVNYEHNLIPIFEAVFFSVDPDLRNLARSHHLDELLWLSNRLIDVYGKKATPYAADCAVLTMGMMQHMIHVWTARTNKVIQLIKLVNFTLHRVDSIMFDMIEKDDTFLDSNVFFDFDKELDEEKYSKENLIVCLNKFNDRLGIDLLEQKQITQFLIDEFTSPTPRIILIEAVVRTFRESFVNTPNHIQAQELAVSIWRYTETVK